MLNRSYGEVVTIKSVDKVVTVKSNGEKQLELSLMAKQLRVKSNGN